MRLVPKPYSILNKEKEMSGAASVKENIQGQDIILKIFEEILKQKLDPILKENSAYHNLLEIDKVKTGYFHK